MKYCCYLLIVFCLFLSIFNGTLKSEDCFAGIKFEQRLIKSVFDEPQSAINIFVPKEAAYGKKYKLTGNWGLHNYAYNIGTYIVAAGWVDDETDSSALFWKTGNFDQRFLDEKNMDNARTFDIEMSVPNDDYAKKHKFLKIQITVSASGDATKFLKSWIYRLPITNLIRGEVLAADIDPGSGAYIISPLMGDKIYANYLKGDVVEGNAVLKETNCYNVTVGDEDLSSSHVRIDRLPNSSDSAGLLNRKITQVPPGAQLTTWIPYGIFDQHRKAYNDLQNVQISANILFDAGKVTIINLPPYRMFDLVDLVSKWRIYEGKYDDYFTGIDTDSIRAEILYRFVIPELAAKLLYKPFHDLCGETMKTSYSCLEAILFLKEIRKVVTDIKWVDDGVQKIAVNASDLISKYVIDGIMATLYQAADHKKTKVLKSAIKTMQLTLGQLCNQDMISGAWKTFQKEAIGNEVLIAGDLIIIPTYVKDNETYVNEAAKFYLDNYPKMPETTDEKSYLCQGKNSDAFDKILKDDSRAYIKMTKNFVDSIMPISKDIRNSSKILDAVSALMNVGEGLIAGGSVALPSAAAPMLATAAIALQTLKLSELMRSLIINIGTMDQFYDLYKVIVHTSFNPAYKPIAIENPEYWFNSGGISYKKDDNNEQISRIKPSGIICNISLTDYINKLDNVISQIDGNDFESLKVKISEMLNVEDSLYNSIKICYSAYCSIYDTTSTKYYKIKSEIGKLTDLIYLGNLTRARLNMSLINKLVNNDIASDSIKQTAQEVKNLLNNLIKSFSDFDLSTANSLRKPAVTIINHKISVDAVERKKPFTLKTTIRNTGSGIINNLIIRLNSDSLYNLSGKKDYTIPQLEEGKEITLDWNLSIEDDTIMTCYYTIDAVSDNAEEDFTGDYIILKDKKYITGIKGEELGNIVPKIDIYPNPSSGEVIIDFENITGSEPQVAIFDILGKKLDIEFDKYVSAGMNRFMVKTISMNPGIYLIKVTSKINTITRKLIIIR